MHIVLGLLGSIITILFLLDRLGIDLGGMNPFYWYRRRAFSEKYSSDPIYSIEDPVHVAALMIIGAAKLAATQRRQVFAGPSQIDGRDDGQSCLR